MELHVFELTEKSGLRYKTLNGIIDELEIKAVKKVILYILFFICIIFAAAAHLWGSSPLFTAEEEQWLSDHAVIRVIVNNGPPPISFWKKAQKNGPPFNPERPHPPFLPPGPEHGKEGMPPKPLGHPGPPEGSFHPLIKANPQLPYVFKGYTADYLKELESILNVQFKVEYFADNNFKLIEEALNTGKADLFGTIILDSNSRFSANRKSVSYLDIPVVMVTRSDEPHLDDLNQLNSKKVAGVFSIQRKLNQLGINTFIRNEGPLPGLMGVSTGKFDVFIAELALVSDVLSRHPVTNIKISGELPRPSRMAMVVSPEFEPFIPILNKSIAALPAESRSRIWRKWFPLNYEKKWISSKWMWLTGIAAALVFIAGVGIGWFFYQRFKKIRTTVDSLDPHLLSISIDKNITITDVTKALCRKTGFDTKELVGKSILVLSGSNEEAEESMKALWAAIQKGDSWTGEIKIVKKNGRQIWTKASVSPLRRKSDANDGYTVIYTDVTSQKHFEKLAIVDELTGLYNRRHFNNIAGAVLTEAIRQKLYFSLILMDVDNFKKYNDQYGHPAGDQVLASIGITLKQIFKRKDDSVFRLGGEEFGAILISPDKDETILIAKEILEKIQALNIDHKFNPPGVITVSIGIEQLLPTSDHLLETIYKNADNALYNAKEKGRNRIFLGP